MYFLKFVNIKKLEFRQLRAGVLNLLCAMGPLGVGVKNTDPFSGKWILKA
jgi:hypothetical protein